MGPETHCRIGLKIKKNALFTLIDFTLGTGTGTDPDNALQILKP
jgi:hypothetical protein